MLYVEGKETESVSNFSNKVASEVLVDSEPMGGRTREGDGGESEKVAYACTC